MVDTLLRSGAFLVTACGMAWLALAMDAHWLQVRGDERLSRSTARALRGMGSAALVASLVLHFLLDHRSIAPLVWVMGLAASALLVAFTLALRPRWLSMLVLWLPKRTS